MSYTISEIAEKMGVSVHTIRYYDKEGLLPNVKRINGRRVFEDTDFSWLRVLNCMRNTGMPIKEIRKYMSLCEQGDTTLQERYVMIQAQKRRIEEEILFLEHNLKELKYKEWYYEKALEAGSESIHQHTPCKPTFEVDQIPKDEHEH